ncbi:ABC transporter substrate-binding protein [Candidatus Solirubrobacter pratensis]|uniref:ABC transporter substrate-binding protein n=1 Tax=Candidatus Solirubrobacter pratensis TaxID=1298857 RepID=UPI00040686ED|nr:ABC transporter substrate-binding protein [Candidatus Solirubrobacter pratensis]
MPHTRLPRVAGIAALALLAFPLAEARAATDVTVGTGFMPNVQFAPYYVAQDLGYYKAAGLNVKMNYDRVPNLLQMVAGGKFTFGASSGDTAIIAKSAGADVRYVAAQYQQYPVGAMWLKNGGPRITKPADLKGKRIGISAPGSSTDYGLRALLKSAGLTRKDVKIVAVGFTETEALVNKQIDVAMTFTDNEPVQAAAIGHPVNVMKVASYVNLTPNGVVTGAEEIRAHRSVVAAFVKATMRGEKYTQQHPDAAFKIALKRLPELVSQKAIDTQRKVLSARLAYQREPKGHPYGWSNPSGWPTTVNFLRGISAIKAKPSVSSVFTNVFAEQANVR